MKNYLNKYDIIFNIDYLENLKIHGWYLKPNDKGYGKKDKKIQLFLYLEIKIKESHLY